MIHKSSPRGLFMFELKSAIGRFLGWDKPMLGEGTNFLNLGCGTNYVKGMVNADFFQGFRFWKKLSRLEWYLDLRYPLNCGDAIFDGVYSEHTLEHLYPDDAMNLLRELHRVMKKGAVIRLTVPDLEKYVGFYAGTLSGESLDSFAKQYDSGVSALRNLSQNYFHLSLWDFAELKRCLLAAGFDDVEKRSFGVGAVPSLCHDLADRSWETIYVEAVKP